ncbi:MAG: potassium channel family protein [Hyphomicrobiaceae bacterium]
MDNAVAVLLSLLLVAATVMVHYEFLRLTSAVTRGLSIPGRAQVLAIIALVFIAHLVEVGLYMAVYYAGHNWWGLGVIHGDTEGGIVDYFYFSITTFTTLGFGDVQPRGPLRLIAGVESLNGLVLIGWSASFTYLSMQRFWQDGSPGARSVTTDGDPDK